MSMIARFVTLVLVAVLALPAAVLTRPTASDHPAWGNIALEAQAKKKKKGKTKTVTRIVRQPLTQTFSNTTPLTIVDGGVDPAPASVYPAQIEVSGFANGTITDVNLILNDLTHDGPSDIDILLSRAGLAANVIVMNEVSNGIGVTDVDLTLDDQAAAQLPAGGAALASGTFRPADHGGGTDLPAPAPSPSGGVGLSAFNGADPNGTWQLWVADDNANGAGDLGGGWVLQITADVDVAQEVQVPKKKKKRGRR